MKDRKTKRLFNCFKKKSSKSKKSSVIESPKENPEEDNNELENPKLQKEGETKIMDTSGLGRDSCTLENTTLRNRDGTLINQKEEISDPETDNLVALIQQKFSIQIRKEERNKAVIALARALLTEREDKDNLCRRYEEEIEEMMRAFEEEMHNERIKFDQELDIIKTDIKSTNNGKDHADTPEKYMNKLIEKNSLLKLETAKLEWRIRSAEKTRSTASNAINSPIKSNPSSPQKVLFQNEFPIQNI